MVRILRCPHCDALWRLTEPAPQYRCGACSKTFTAEEAKHVDVAEEKLNALLAEEKATRAAQAEAEKDALVASAQPVEQVSAAPRPALYVTKRSGAKAFLLLIFGFLCFLVALASGFLLMHQFVLAQAPFLRPVYEKVCTQVPCPQFYWTNAKAFRAEGSLEPDQEKGLKSPAVRMRLTNTSEHPQQLPSLEVKLLDPAGDTIASRVLDPVDYGFPQKPAVLPAGESTETMIDFKIELAHDAAGVSIRPLASDNGR
ncbi:DUF3426 domain-containing protein [Sutterella sp.]|uniref:DUF3426 domain-containing protein n=1 Tax=Sutterella sp. TaxID=1981025 RepID=UPI0026DF185C|nr:DUF3426 domain-containing protein [Sutterella sp.]MDO5531847.1 DUF3426 domain-containing protein [Sutterella sp.]